jgi:N-acetylglucosaminyl-diphospho-decaprenol L-rhamnosyltransferase
MNLLIVIVNYRVAHLTIDCLRSLSDQIRTVPGAHVAVCENGTGDDSAERIAAAIREGGWEDWVSLTSIFPNRGFTGGNNVVLRAALQSADPPRYVLLLNADTIVRPGALSELVKFMDAHPQVAIAGSALEDPDGVVRSGAYRFLSVLGEAERTLAFGPLSRLLERWKIAPAPGTTCRPVDWVSGASMIIRREFLERDGLLDEDLYTYFDDVDMGLRAWRAGWEVWYVPQSVVMHLEGQATGISTHDQRPKRRPEYWFWARRHFFLKSYGAWRTAGYDAAWIVFLALRRLRYWVQHKPDSEPPRMLYDALRFSVFMTGFKRKPVQNPALRSS